jgi:AraC-like DNA-binding protein
MSPVEIEVVRDFACRWCRTGEASPGSHAGGVDEPLRPGANSHCGAFMRWRDECGVRAVPLKGGLGTTQETRAKERLLLRASERKSLADIARECGLSRAHFIRAFTRTTGCTPHQWLLRQRIEQARWLIEHSDRSLTDIASDCEFSDQSHLNRVFVKAFGVSPGAWRRAVRQQSTENTLPCGDRASGG